MLTDTQTISALHVGDLMLAHDEALGTTGYYTITAILAHDDPIIVYVTIDGEQIETTPEHPFYTGERGWVTAGELRVGDHIRNAKGEYGVVQATAIVQRPQPMYNLTVAEAHTFFVGDKQWLVHNDCHLKLYDGIHLTTNEALEAADHFLGPGATHYPGGRSVSADGLRQVRMLDVDIAGATPKHMNFETFVRVPWRFGRTETVSNWHVYLTD